VKATAFEKLLFALATDRGTAGDKYELIRLKLVSYFEWRHCPDAATLADQVFDRVAHRLEGGEQIRSSDIMTYFYGVAHNLLLEHWRSQQRLEKAIAERRSVESPVLAEREAELLKPKLDCLRKCLAELPADARSLVIRYHNDSGGGKAVNRSELAGELGIPINALRIRVHRIKSQLRRCVEKCLSNAKPARNG
jgi:RNA polymerase sigma factor (sigma-70 family)